MSISLSLKKNLLNEPKHNSDRELNKRALNISSCSYSNRNKFNLNGSTISTLCTNTNMRVNTPCKIERKITKDISTTSSRGANATLNQMLLSAKSSHTQSHTYYPLQENHLNSNTIKTNNNSLNLQFSSKHSVKK